MSWFADLAGKAENLLNNLDEQTGAALRNHNVARKRFDGHGTDFGTPHSNTETWVPKKRLTRSPKRAMPIPDTTKIFVPTRKSSPTSHNQPHATVREIQDFSRNSLVKTKKSPTRKSNPPRPYNVEHCPKTLVRDVIEKDTDVLDHFAQVLKLRRRSLPSDLELPLLDTEEFTYKMQNMEVENAMLKNELNVMNREVTELVERLHKTEDGNDDNDVDKREVIEIRIQQKTSEGLNYHLTQEKQTLTSQVELLSKKIQEHTDAEVAKYMDLNQRLEAEITTIRNYNYDLEEKCKKMQESTKDREAVQNKLENDLRHAQSTVNDLQANLQKTTDECRRLEKDWEAYKLRVKNMLQAKDVELKKLQDGVHIHEDTKAMMEQVVHLKVERDELQDAVASVRSECDDLKLYVQQIETRHSAAERVVAALRDALREERNARNRAEANCVAIAKEMKAVQMETGQTIASLRTVLRENEQKLNHLREVSTVQTTDSSALNVADYDTIDNNKVHYLTQTLVQRQTKIDNLLAENNMLRIQLEKLESKFKAEKMANREKFSHSVVHLQESDSRRGRAYNTPSTLSALSLRLGVMVKRNPIFRMFIIGYMVCLHFWVITVLFTSTPEDYVPPSKS